MKKTTDKNSILKAFKTIPYVGDATADDFYRMGYRTISDFKNENPERMYTDLMKLEGAHVDRCMLYVMRMVVYYASTKHPKPDLLKWWNWKDKHVTLK